MITGFCVYTKILQGITVSGKKKDWSFGAVLKYDCGASGEKEGRAQGHSKTDF